MSSPLCTIVPFVALRFYHPKTNKKAAETSSAATGLFSLFRQTPLPFLLVLFRLNSRLPSPAPAGATYGFPWSKRG